MFGHNDTHENNFLNKKGPDGKIADCKIIDFEYAELNFRGTDIAAYLCEMSINYKTSLDCGYEYYPELFPNMKLGAKGESAEFVRYLLHTYL